MKNNIWFLAITILLSLILLGGLVTPDLSNAQYQRLLFAVTQYQPGQNLDFFFAHSVHPITYYEEGNTNTPMKTAVFLSIITPEQKEEYIKAGYRPVIVDEDAGDLRQYYVLYSREPNQSFRLEDPELEDDGLEMYYPVTDYITLIKLDPDSDYSDLDIRGGSRFHARRFFMNLIPPTDRTTSAAYQSFLTPTPMLRFNIMQKAQRQQPSNKEFILALIVLSGVLGFVWFTTKRHKNTSK